MTDTPDDGFNDPHTDPRLMTLTLSRIEFAALFACANMTAMMIVQSREASEAKRKLTAEDHERARAGWISSSIALDVIGPDGFNGLIERCAQLARDTWPGRLTIINSDLPEELHRKIREIAAFADIDPKDVH